MRKFSLHGGVEYLRMGFTALNQMHIPQLAANTGYFIVLSVFPALLLILSGLRYTGLSVDDLLELLEGVLPQAMMGTARELILSVCHLWRHGRPGLSLYPLHQHSLYLSV